MVIRKQKKPKKYPAFDKSDTVGLGFFIESNEVFFTHNGKQLGDMVVNTQRLEENYVTVTLRGEGNGVYSNFGTEPFLYDIQKHLKEEKVALSKSVLSSCSIEHFDLHCLVLEHLVHTGQFATAKAFMQETKMTLRDCEKLMKGDTSGPSVKNEAKKPGSLKGFGRSRSRSQSQNEQLIMRKVTSFQMESMRHKVSGDQSSSNTPLIKEAGLTPRQSNFNFGMIQRMQSNVSMDGAEDAPSAGRPRLDSACVYTQQDSNTFLEEVTIWKVDDDDFGNEEMAEMLGKLRVEDRKSIKEVLVNAKDIEKASKMIDELFPGFLEKNPNAAKLLLTADFLEKIGKKEMDAATRIAFMKMGQFDSKEVTIQDFEPSQFSLEVFRVF